MQLLTLPMHPSISRVGFGAKSVLRKTEVDFFIHFMDPLQCSGPQCSLAALEEQVPACCLLVFQQGEKNSPWDLHCSLVDVQSCLLTSGRVISALPKQDSSCNHDGLKLVKGRSRLYLTWHLIANTLPFRVLLFPPWVISSLSMGRRGMRNFSPSLLCLFPLLPNPWPFPTAVLCHPLGKHKVIKENWDPSFRMSQGLSCFQRWDPRSLIGAGANK